MQTIKRSWYAISEAFEEPGVYSPHPTDWYQTEAALMAQMGIPADDIAAIEWEGTDVVGRDEIIFTAVVPLSVSAWIDNNALAADDEDHTEGDDA